MEQNIKKERSLNRFFILFLAHAVLSFLCTTALWVCLLSASAYFGIVSPANTTEHAVSDWCASLDGQKTITPADIPAGAGYAFLMRMASCLRQIWRKTPFQMPKNWLLRIIRQTSGETAPGSVSGSTQTRNVSSFPIGLSLPSALLTCGGSFRMPNFSSFCCYCFC